MQISNIAYRRNRLSVLRQPHCPTSDHPLRAHKHLSSLLDGICGQATGSNDLVPITCVEADDQIVVAECFSTDKIMIEDRARNGSFTLEHYLHHPLQHGHIAADPYRQMQVGKCYRRVSNEIDRKTKCF